MTRRLPPPRRVWKLLFALAALVDIHRTLREDVDLCPDDDAAAAYQIRRRTNKNRCLYFWTSPAFCALCLLEALLRSRDARLAALHNTALDELERQMLEFARRSGRRLSRMFGDSAPWPIEGEEGGKNELLFIDQWMRFNRRCWTWIPAAATLAFWMCLLPTDFGDFSRCGCAPLKDSAIFAQWLFMVSRALSALSVSWGRFVDGILWTRVMPYRIHREPARFVKRLKVLLEGIRFVRFAGPLARMGLKLHDQLRTMWRSRRQSRKSQQRKETHVASPSLIFADIQNLKSLAKIQTSLARIPSFALSSPALENIASTVKESYAKRRADAKRIAAKISKLHDDFLRGGGAASDIYDRIVDANNELANSLKADRSLRNRYLMAPRSLLSSSKYLISPRTRFSLSWRIAVTNCLLLEIFRLVASWRLSQTFSVPLSQVAAKLLAECKAPRNKNAVVFLSDRINEFRGRVFDLLPILGPKPVDVAACAPTGAQAAWILWGGTLLERFVDAVVFLDIFVWFFTGDLDVDTHGVIPKPFVARCIIPGTLVQVLDHPTLPTLLPNMLKAALRVSKTIGYSRVVRWILAIAPAATVLLLDPLKKFMFRHIKEDEGIMRYAESVGMLSPERKVARGSDNASDSIAGAASPTGFFRRLSGATLNNSSQVGLAFDLSPEPSRQDLQSLVPTEDSVDSDVTTGGESVERTGVPHLPGILHNAINSEEHPALIPMARSPSKNRRSVHFGFLDTSGIGSELKSSEFSVSFD